MVTFKQYFLTENILSNVRASILGLQVTSELPPRSPYGFWVDRSGNYKAIDTFASGGHAQAAKEILMNAFNYKDETNQLDRHEEKEFTTAISKGFNSLYRILFELNYMHLVKGGNTYFYYIEGGGLPTTSQQKFLNNLRQTYNTGIERSREIY